MYRTNYRSEHYAEITDHNNVLVGFATYTSGHWQLSLACEFQSAELASGFLMGLLERNYHGEIK